MLNTLRKFVDSTMIETDRGQVRWTKWGFVWASANYGRPQYVFVIARVVLGGRDSLELCGDHVGCLVHLKRTKNYELLQWSQLVSMLFFPATLMWLMGGFRSGGGLVIFSALRL
jgi:hypothetical protein